MSAPMTATGRKDVAGQVAFYARELKAR